MSSPPSMDRAPSQSRLSAVAVDSADVALDERKMYAVEWRDGATFGFTVTPVNSDRGTVLLLARRTARREQLQTAGLEDVVPGDLLVAIGDEKVYHLGADHAATYLRSVPKPVRLTLQLSPYGNQSKQLPDLAPNEYHYLWEDGPLGIVLTYDTKSKLPMVKRLSDKANDIVRRDVAISDQLMYCNDVPTNEYSMDEVMSILREMPKPVLLRFRKQLQDDHLVELPELAENEYEFLWDYGPLGLVIGMSRSGLPFVRSFTGLGTSRQLNLVQEDDEIVMVNDKSAKDEGFRETMQYLMNVPKPAVLRFRRKSRHSSPSEHDRASQALRASQANTISARPSAPGYQSPAVPDCVGPLSPIAPLSMTAQQFHDIPRGPLSPQVRVSLDRSRFRSVSSSAPVEGERVSGPLLKSPSHRAAPHRTSASAAQRASDGDEFQDARGPQCHPASPASGKDGERDTSILPPDPNASRSSIFTFQYEGEANGVAPAAAAPTVAAEPSRPRRISARTGSMPPDPVVEPMARPDELLVRSLSSRPVATTTDPTQSFVPLPEPPVKEQASGGGDMEGVKAPKPLSPVPPETAPPAKVRSSRGAKPPVDTAELVAEPAPKPVEKAQPAAKPAAKPTSQRSGNYVDTADLVADPTPLQPKGSPVDNQRDAGAHVAKQPSPQPQPPVKTRPSASKSNQIEDTAELGVDPVPKKSSTATKKSYVDTADLVAEPAKVEKPVAAAKPKKEKAYIDTAELFAEPPAAAAPKKAPAPAKKQAYEDTADLVADPPSKKKEKAYVDTADLVAVPAAAAAVAPKPKPSYIDTAELFAEPPAPKPAAVAVATPASAPVAAAPTAAAPGQPKSTPPAASTNAAPPSAAPMAEPLEFFTVEPDAFYTVQWTDGPFGSTVREADSNTGPVMLITKRTGKQTCRGLRRIAVGDLLVRIGDKDVSSMGFEKATRYLRKVPKPVPLTFMAVD